MLRKLLLFLWLLIPLGLLAFHYGPGRIGMARDEAARRAARATKLEAGEDWPGAMAAYAEALAKLPLTDRATRWSLRLAHARTRMKSGELPEAMSELDALGVELQRVEPNSPQLEAIRANLAAAEYYAGWRMRLEGAAEEEWMAEVESARKQFHLLAREKARGGRPANQEYQENLEATIRLARMDLGELQEMPLPKFCLAGANVSEKCRRRRLRKPAPGAAQTRVDPNPLREHPRSVERASGDQGNRVK